jgi:hypothetical protein
MGGSADRNRACGHVTEAERSGRVKDVLAWGSVYELRYDDERMPVNGSIAQEAEATKGEDAEDRYRRRSRGRYWRGGGWQERCGEGRGDWRRSRYRCRYGHTR